MRTVLFICTHNSARSQMAEGIVNSIYSDVLHAESAGTVPTRVHPLAIRAMAEIGINISGQVSKSLSSFQGREFDYKVTMCSDAEGRCPLFIGGKEHIHHAFMDPASVEGTESDKIDAFRTVGKEIEEWILGNLVQSARKPSRYRVPPPSESTNYSGS